MNETILNLRQKTILNLINDGGEVSSRELQNLASKATLSRDLELLLAKKLIRKVGKARNTRYFPINANPVLKNIDIESYFSVDPDNRTGVKTGFNFDIFSHLNNLFSPEEIFRLQKIGRSFRNEDKKELERFVIELSWKSSKIEGNTYSLLDTETLIKEQIEAEGHSKKEATMILNHKRAFEEILKNKADFKTLSVSQITQLHNFLVAGLDVSAGVRSKAVGITGTTYKPLGNQWQIKEALEKYVGVINKTVFPLEKALITIAMISYVQPFADGNKRTARMLANALLLAFDFFPLSYRSVDETFFKKALVLFYEQNSILALKQIIIDQYNFALKTYFPGN